MRQKLNINGEQVVATIKQQGDTAVVSLDGTEYRVSDLGISADGLKFVHDGQVYDFSYLVSEQGVAVSDGRQYHTAGFVRAGAQPEEELAGELSSKMPGTVLKLLVEPGSQVDKGTPLMILEAMKMEHEICAPSAGTLTAFRYSPGDRVMPGDLLVDFAESE